MKIVTITHRTRVVARFVVGDDESFCIEVPLDDGRRLTVTPSITGFVKPVVSDDAITVLYTIK